MIAMGFSVFGCAALCALSPHLAAFVLLWAPSLGTFDPATEVLVDISE
jgi:hypothetical protein